MRQLAYLVPLSVLLIVGAVAPAAANPTSSLGVTGALAGVSAGSLEAVGEVLPSSGDRIAETAERVGGVVPGR